MPKISQSPPVATRKFHSSSPKRCARQIQLSISTQFKAEYRESVQRFYRMVVLSSPGEGCERGWSLPWSLPVCDQKDLVELHGWDPHRCPQVPVVPWAWSPHCPGSPFCPHAHLAITSQHSGNCPENEPELMIWARGTENTYSQPGPPMCQNANWDGNLIPGQTVFWFLLALSGNSSRTSSRPRSFLGPRV